MAATTEINDFRFQYRWLSNFHVAPIRYEGILYPSTEHAYQAAKSLDEDVRHHFAALPTPRDAKRAGRTVALRGDWEYVKNRVMYDVCFAKFTSHHYLWEALVATGDTKLVEGNTWNDTYWGVCNGVGRNQLGITLMVIRDVLNARNAVNAIRALPRSEQWIERICDE